MDPARAAQLADLAARADALRSALRGTGSDEIDVHIRSALGFIEQRARAIRAEAYGIKRDPRDDG